MKVRTDLNNVVSDNNWSSGSSGINQGQSGQGPDIPEFSVNGQDIGQDGEQSGAVWGSSGGQDWASAALAAAQKRKEQEERIKAENEAKRKKSERTIAKEAQEDQIRRREEKRQDSSPKVSSTKTKPSSPIPTNDEEKEEQHSQSNVKMKSSAKRQSDVDIAGTEFKSLKPLLELIEEIGPVGVSANESRRERIRGKVNSLKNARKAQAKTKQTEFRPPSKPKNPAKPVASKTKLGPAIPVDPRGFVNTGRGPMENTEWQGPPVPVSEEGVVQTYHTPENTPVALALRNNTGSAMVPVNSESRLAADPDRPRVVIPPRYNGYPMGDGTPERLALPGSIGHYTYATSTYDGDERSQEQIIDDRIKEQAETAPLEQMYPNAVSSEIDLVTADEYRQDYDQGVDSEGNNLREVGRYENRSGTDPASRLREIRARVLAWFHKAYIPLKSEHIDENGYIRYDELTEAAIANYMNHMGFAPEERYVVMQQVIQVLGFSPDRKGLFFGKDERVKIDDSIFIEALNNMMLSCRLYGHPYAIVNPGMVLGGTRCYPVGVLTMHEAKILCKPGHIFEGEDPWDVINRAADTWFNETLPTIRRNVYREPNGEAQMIVLMDMARTLCSLDGISPAKYGIPNEEIGRGYESMKAETIPGYRGGETEDDLKTMKHRQEFLDRQLARHLKLKKADRERSEIRLDKIRNRTKRTYNQDYVDENGVHHSKGDRVMPWENVSDALVNFSRNERANAFDSVCMSVANMAKFAGVVGYVPIIGSGVIEHAQGNLNTIAANWLLFGTSDRATFKPSAAMYDYITSEEGLEGIAAWKSLMHVGGQDALIMFYQEYKDLNKENAQKFINEFVKRKGSEKLVPRKLKDLMNRAEESVAWLMPGDMGFARADAKRWLDSFMLNNKFAASDPQTLEYSFTADQVQEMMENMGVGRFLAAVTETRTGRDAMLMARNQTFDRVSPLNHIVDRILRVNGVTNMVITLGIDTYFTYGLNLIQLMIPFSNTFSYLAVKGINYSVTGGHTNIDNLDLSIMDYQMGGHDRFVRGLWKNIIYDVTKLGNIVLIGGFMYFVVKALGFDEPEDESLKYVWSEYKIGRNINLGGNDENGNPTGIPVYAAWWLNDLTLFGLPMAYALNARELEQKLGDNDPELPEKLFRSGCYDMLTGCSLLDLIKTVTKTQEDFKTYEQMMQDPDVKCPPDWFSFAMFQVEMFAARTMSKLTPNMLKSLKTDTLIVGDQAFDHSPYVVYDRGDEDPSKTTSEGLDWMEIQRRVESKYNPVYALFNNLTKNHYLFDDGSTDKTGYRFEEMPIMTMKDQLKSYWANKYDFDFDNIPGGEENRIPYTESLLDQVIEDIKSFSSPEEAISQGYMIPPALRFKMRDYCYQHINFEENLFNQKLSEGWIPTDEFTDMQTQMKNNKQYWYNILNNWVFNDNIPWTDDGYARLITSTQDVYYYKESGKPATVFDYWELGPEMIEQKYVPRGDHPSMLAPFTSPDNRDKGHNYETISSWYREGESGTNLDRIREMLNQPVTGENGEVISEKPLVKYGKDAGVFVDTAIFGGSPTFATNQPTAATSYGAFDEPTMGYRAYVPWEDKFLFDLPNFNGYVNEDGKLVRGNGEKVSTTVAMFDGLRAKSREDVDGESSMGDMGKYKDKDDWKKSTYPSWSNKTWASNGKMNYGRRSSGSGGSSSGYNPKIYSTKVNPGTKISNTRGSTTRISPDARSVNNDKAATMFSKIPGDAKLAAYLRPGFTTKGSREAYKRQDI